MRLNNIICFAESTKIREHEVAVQFEFQSDDVPTESQTSPNEPKPDNRDPRNPHKRPKRSRPPHTTLYNLQEKQVDLLSKQMKELSRIADLLQERNSIEREKLILKKMKYGQS